MIYPYVNTITIIYLLFYIFHNLKDFFLLKKKKSKSAH